MEYGRHRRCRWRIAQSLVIVTLLAALAVVVDAAQRKEIDYDALEKSWEANDAPHEVRSPADDQYDRLSAMSPPEAKAMGPQMVFVTLDTREPLSELASRWKEMLWNGGVDVNIYEIEASKLLVGLQRGLFVRELRLFLRQQHEVVTYEWNSKTYTRNDAVDQESTGPTGLLNKSKKGKPKKSKRKAKKMQETIHHRPTVDEL